MDIKAVIYDKDGTLMDFQASWAPWAKAVLESLSDTPEQVMRAAEVLGFDLMAMRFLEDSVITAGTPEDITEIARACFPTRTEPEIMAAMQPDMDQFHPATVEGMRASCEALVAQGIKLAVVTNDFEAVGKEHMNMMGLSDLFGPILGYDSGFGGKPAPDGCLAAARMMGVAPETCVMVGDSLHDIHAGAAAGMRTVGVLTGVVGRDVLTPEADVVLEDATHVPQWIDSSGA